MSIGFVERGVHAHHLVHFSVSAKQSRSNRAAILGSAPAPWFKASARVC